MKNKTTKNTYLLHENGLMTNTRENGTYDPRKTHKITKAIYYRLRKKSRKECLAYFAKCKTRKVKVLKAGTVKQAKPQKVKKVSTKKIRESWLNDLQTTKETALTFKQLFAD